MVKEKYNEEQKMIIQAENDLIYKYVLQNLKIKPYAISRDKNGHILLLEYKSNTPCDHTGPAMYCYMLGINIKENKVVPYLVGINNFNIVKQYYDATFEDFNDKVPNCLCVNKLAVHEAFNNLNIGRILLQTVENYATENHLNTMMLNALKCYNIIDGKVCLTKDQNEYEEFVRNNYFDKNLFFYYSQGFIENYHERHQLLHNYRPLIKQRLNKVVLDYGLDKPLRKLSKKNYIFSIRRDEEHPLDCIAEYTYSNLFPDVLNEIKSEYFSPIVVGEDNTSLDLINNLFNKFNYKSFEVPSSEKYYQGEIVSACDFIKINNIHYNHLAEHKEFMSLIINSHKQRSSQYKNVTIEEIIQGKTLDYNEPNG